MADRKRNLEAEMVRKGISRSDLEKVLGLSRQSFLKKITGQVDFKCGEMFEIKDALHTELTLDELFS